ncbi:MAG TPA: hypothetical protein DDW52_22090 [Planctomycetaceae bacterium]|nr:hypothetical protein [Planctomycetaceae bacterium]
MHALSLTILSGFRSRFVAQGYKSAGADVDFVVSCEYNATSQGIPPQVFLPGISSVDPVDAFSSSKV